jgi:ribosomal protein L40E
MTSSLRSIECLFCKHPNPVGASFCNECGSSLDVQLCDRCGAIDKRTAHTCYKCGATFPLSATSEVAADSVADDRDSARATPARQSTAAAMTLAGTAQAGTTPPESVPQALAVWRRRAQHAGNPSRKPLPGNAVGESTQARRAQAQPAAPTPVEATVAVPATAPPTAAFRPTWWLALAALLLVAIAAALYYTQQRSAQVAEHPSTPPLSSQVAGPPTAVGAGLTPAAPKPEADAGGQARSEPARARECPEAVAALGLCNANVKQGRQ